jgi:hypothetical protein
MKYSLLATVALVLLFPSASVADPVAITSGRITFTDEPGGFHVAGSGFDVFVGWFPEGGWNPCAACAPGSIIDLTRTYTFSELFQGHSGMINGVSYDALFTTGELAFVGPVIVAPFDNEHGPVPGPFTFRGSVSMFSNEARIGPPVFASELIGAGTAGAIGFVSDSGFELEDLVYRFAPVPEPSTLLMLASGVLGAATLKRRCSKSPDPGHGIV